MAGVYQSIKHRSRDGRSTFLRTNAGNIGAPINWLAELPENAHAVELSTLRTAMKAARSTKKPHQAKADEEIFIDHSHHFDDHQRASASLKRDSVSAA